MAYQKINTNKIAYLYRMEGIVTTGQCTFSSVENNVAENQYSCRKEPHL